MTAVSGASEALAARVKSRALAMGFHRVGIADAGPLTDDHARYLDFLDRGHHGEMGWLAAHPDVRRGVDSPDILAGARSVIVCALSYHRAGDEPTVHGATVARYARGRDYHNFLRKRLRQLAAWVRATTGGAARPMVDTAPVLERAWARKAGVGFVGKNGCVIAPGLGSYILLGEVVTTVELTPDTPMAERCGTCTLCLDGCPTAAFPAPFTLDARRCVSYLTIELRGAMPEALRPGVGDRLFGCDVCQDVCPFNRTRPPDGHGTRHTAPDGRWDGVSLTDLVTLDADRWQQLTHGTALVRAGHEGLSRNAAVVLGNTGTRRHLPVLTHTAATHPSAVVREAAAWAIPRIEARCALEPPVAGTSGCATGERSEPT